MSGNYRTLLKNFCESKESFHLPDAPALQRLVNNDSQPNEAFDFSDVLVLFIFVRSLLFVYFFDHETSQFQLSSLPNYQPH